MRKVKSVFIVLHYNEKAMADTIECVESIQISFSNRDDFQIIIVENGSGDNSAQILENNYKNNSLVEIIISQENLGFAKGNNLGCKRAIDLYNPQFLIVINNDTVIKQTEFLDKLYSRYSHEKFHVLGPYIYDRNLLPQNPNLNLKTTIEEVEKAILVNKKLLKSLDSNWYHIKLRCKKIIKFFPLVEEKLRKILKKELSDKELATKELKNVGLHGSALIFTKDYYEKYSEIFYSKTFMFIEEDILYYRILQDKLISIYYPELEIYHKEDRSTDATLTSSIAQKNFAITNNIKSLEVYKEFILSSMRNSTDDKRSFFK